MTIANVNDSPTRNALLVAINIMKNDPRCFDPEIDALQCIVDQRGCEHVEPNCEHLTQLIDVFVYG